MIRPAVLVIGPEKSSLDLARALGGYAVDAWTDRRERLVDDPAMLAWADAVVVIDTSAELKLAEDPRLRDFDGVRLLAAAVALPLDRIEALMDSGYDAVLRWPQAIEVLAARVAAMTRAPRQQATWQERRLLAA